MNSIISFHVFLWGLLIAIRQINQSSLIFDQINLICIIGLFYKTAIHRKHLSKELVKKTCASLLVFNLLASFSLLNVDRSRSYFLLSWINEKKVSITNGKIDLSRIMSDERKNGLQIESRISEQTHRNLVVKKDELYSLTTFGQLVLKASELIAIIFRLDGWKKNKNYQSKAVIHQITKSIFERKLDDH